MIAFAAFGFGVVFYYFVIDLILTYVKKNNMKVENDFMKTLNYVEMKKYLNFRTKLRGW